ncbi:transposase [Haemophilus parahaemolyticus]
MKRVRHFFSLEFKAEVVKLVQERGYSVSQACRELDSVKQHCVVGLAKF